MGKATDPYSGDYPQSLGEKHRTTLLALADLLHTRGVVADEELARAWNRETDAYTRTLEAKRNDLKRPFVRPRPRRSSGSASLANLPRSARDSWRDFDGGGASWP